MEKKKLLEALQEIHTQLEAADPVDDEVRQLLASVTHDIDRILDDQQETTDDDSQQMNEGLNRMIARFEAEHPDLMALISRVTEGLANLGI